MSTLEHREWSAGTTKGDPTVEYGNIIHRLCEQVYSEGNLNMAEELVAADFRGHCAGTSEDYLGVSGLKAHASRLRATFPGIAVEIDELRSTEEGFEGQLTAGGRFERAFGDVDPRCVIGAAGEEPSGGMVEITGVVSGALAEGQLRHCTFDWDIDALRDQR